MKSTKDIIKKILSEQVSPEGEEFSPPEGPHNDYYDVGLSLRRIVVDPDDGNWIDTDYIDEESIQTSYDLKEAEKMYQRKLYEIKFFDTKGKIKESRDYSNKEQVKEMIADNLTNEIISMLDYGDIKLTYEDLNDILTNVFENAEFLFMNDDSYLNEQRAFNRSEVDIDVVLELMKYKYGYGDLASGWIEEFEEELGNETLSTINSLEYADLLHRFIQKAEEDSRRYDDRINYNSGHAGYDDRNYQYGNKPDDYYSEDDIINLDEQMEFEPKGMDFWLEELSEFAIHLENGVYDEHDELSFDDLTEYDIGEIQRILEDAMEDKTLNDNERTLVFEYGQGIIDSIQRTI